jgi:hypothetical protein
MVLNVLSGASAENGNEHYLANLVSLVMIKIIR